MNRKAYIPAPDGLEPRVALSTVYQVLVEQTTLPPATFGGGKVDKSIKYLQLPFGAANPANSNPYQGIPNGYNYTSGNFYKLMTTGYPGVNGLNTDLARFQKSGNTAVLYQQLSLLAGHVPFGLVPNGLLYDWGVDLFLAGRLPLGVKLNGTTPTIPSVPTGTNAQLAQTIDATLLIYLQDGIGREFNIVKSGGPHPTDILLTFNGKV